jgi:hypothetical protein
MIFGTYVNPPRFDGESGFDQPASVNGARQ